MGWLKKIIDEVEAEWNKQNTSTNEQTQTQSLFSEEQLQEMEQYRQHVINWCAKANYGVLYRLQNILKENGIEIKDSK